MVLEYTNFEEIVELFYKNETFEVSDAEPKGRIKSAS